MAAIELYPIVCARQRHCSGEMLGAYGPGVEAFQRIDHEIADTCSRSWCYGSWALVAAFTSAGRRLSSNWLTHPVLVVSPVNNRKLLGLEDQCALSIIFPTGAYAPDSEERLWDVARAVKDELTPVRTAQGLSTVFSGFRQLMSTSPDVAHIAAFELQVCACEGTAITAAALNATAAWRSPPEVDRCRHGYGSTRGICSILAGGEQCRRPPIFRPA